MGTGEAKPNRERRELKELKVKSCQVEAVVRNFYAKEGLNEGKKASFQCPHFYEKQCGVEEFLSAGSQITDAGNELVTNAREESSVS